MLVILAGCSETGLTTVGSGPGDDDDVVAPPLEIVVAAAPAFDPVRAPLALAVHAPADHDLVLTIDGPDGLVWQAEGTTDGEGTFGATWDGRGSDGELAPVGAYTVTAALEVGSDEAEVVSLRTGFAGAFLEGDGGVTASRERIWWPVDRALDDDGDPVGLTDPALDFPAVPDGPMAIRPDGAEPAAFRYDSRPILTLAAPVEAGFELAEVEVTAAGWTAVDGVPLQPGVPVVLQRDDPLGDTVGVSELDVALVFSAGGVEIGTQHLPLRIYRVLDGSQFERPDEPYRAWAPVLEGALPAIEGTPAEAEAVVDALVDFVFSDLGLVYDTNSGASAYSVYQGWDLSQPHFLLSDFLVRRFGDVINCSDAANILGAYANMVGAPLDHLILDPGFDLNYIQAIGHAEFTSCPFGAPWGCSFSYHAVTTVPGTQQVWDATLAMDGDADPGALPATAQLVQQVTAAEYLFRLVRAGNPQYNNQAQETLQ